MRNLKRKTCRGKREDDIFLFVCKTINSCCLFRDHKELLSSHSLTPRTFAGTVQNYQPQGCHHGPVVWKV